MFVYNISATTNEREIYESYWHESHI